MLRNATSIHITSYHRAKNLLPSSNRLKHLYRSMVHVPHPYDRVNYHMQHVETSDLDETSGVADWQLLFNSTARCDHKNRSKARKAAWKQSKRHMPVMVVADVLHTSKRIQQSSRMVGEPQPCASKGRGNSGTHCSDQCCKVGPRAIHRQTAACWVRCLSVWMYVCGLSVCSGMPVLKAQRAYASAMNPLRVPASKLLR